MNTNYLCIIDGDYKIYKTREEIQAVGNGSSGESSSNNSSKVIELIEFYRKSLSQIQSDETFELVQSKDGAELFGNMLKTYGVTGGGDSLPNEVSDKALGEFLSVMTASGLFDRVSHFTVNQATTTTLAESPSYVAFVVADFDSDHDRAFARLEDAQFKLTNLATIASSTSSTALASLSFASFNFTPSYLAMLANSNSQPQKRFIIVGWPVIYYCIKNELVLYFFLKVINCF